MDSYAEATARFHAGEVMNEIQNSDTPAAALESVNENRQAAMLDAALRQLEEMTSRCRMPSKTSLLRRRSSLRLGRN